MRLLPTMTAAVAALAFAACGGDDEQQAATTTTTDRPPETEPAIETGEGAEGQDPRGLEVLVAETEDVLQEVTDAARQVADDPQAVEEADLRELADRAERLAAEARAAADPAVDQAGEAADTAREQAESGADAAREELSEPERAELRARLAVANERAARAADRLERVTDPRDAARVAEVELRDAEGELTAVVEQLGDELPADVRSRAEEVREQVGELVGK